MEPGTHQRHDEKAQEGFVDPEFPDAIDVLDEDIQKGKQGFSTFLIIVGVCFVLLIIAAFMAKQGFVRPQPHPRL